MEKPFWKSKLFWLGAIQILMGVLNYVYGYLENGTVFTFLGLLTVVLRAVTETRITLK